MKFLWINEKASLKGGAEQYIYDTVKAMNNLNIPSSLLYDANEEIQEEFVDIFEEAYPMASTYEQIININPDFIYVHQLDDYSAIEDILNSNIPTAKFFHDHKLFCLREHKYTFINKTTCTKKLGLGCYSCLGFLNKSDNALGISFNSLRDLQKLQDINKKFDQFIVASDYMKNHLELHDFNSNAITVNPLYASEKFTFSDKTNFSKNKTLLFVGQLLTGKGLDLLLEVMPQINKEYNLVVIGEGKQKDYFVDLSKKLGIENRVDFKGRLTHSQLVKYYEETYCLIIPSRAPETFNLVGIEAQKVGVPVIATDVGGISQWLKDNLNGLLVESNNKDNLRDKINLIIEDKKLHNRICYNILKVNIYPHDLKAHIDLLLNTFQNKPGVKYA